MAVCPAAVTLPDLQGVHAAWRFIAPASRKHKCAKVTRAVSRARRASISENARLMVSDILV